VTGTITGSLRFGRPYVPPARDGTAVASGPLSLDVRSGTVQQSAHLTVARIGGLPGSRGFAGDAILDAGALLSAARLERGDWLAVLWEPGTCRLTCIRSAHGRLRLFWHRHGDALRFSTRLADLFPTGGPPRRLDEDILADMLANRMTTYDRTPFAGLWRLPAGHLLEADTAGAVRVRRWHHPTVTPLRVDHETAVRELRARLNAVLIDHVDPAGTGVLVSGGVDSTSVLAFARRAAGAAPVAGCALIFPGQRHDESHWLDVVDEHTHDPVYRLVARKYDWPMWTEWSARTLLPPLRPNAATMDAAEASFAAAGIRVVLTGEGGDDWFSGPPLHWPRDIAAGRMGRVWREAQCARPTLRSTAGMLWHAGAAPLLPAALLPARFRPPSHRPTVPPWIGAGFAARTGLAERIRAADAAFRRSARDPVAARLARVDQPNATWLGEAIRERSAERGVARMHPLRDQRVTDLVLSLPSDVTWQPGTSKSLLRAAIAGVVPDAIARRRCKATFGARIAAALRSFGSVGSLANHPMVTEGYVHLPALRDLENAVLAGVRPRRRGETLNALWAVVGTAVWFSAVEPT
jgi:asparagine synthase (glutamine-hydrolysing)